MPSLDAVSHDILDAADLADLLISIRHEPVRIAGDQRERLFQQDSDATQSQRHTRQ
jgi:hypothetical protein